MRPQPKTWEASTQSALETLDIHAQTCHPPSFSRHCSHFIDLFLTLRIYQCIPMVCLILKYRRDAIRFIGVAVLSDILLLVLQMTKWACCLHKSVRSGDGRVSWDWRKQGSTRNTRERVGPKKTKWNVGEGKTRCMLHRAAAVWRVRCLRVLSTCMYDEVHLHTLTR